ncbi:MULTISPECIES: DNA topoisomerase IB [Cupriavidus]|uniref:DNA topoisomerase n=1 Tax=Cupriavidus pauculus TaxID=82633 RepID=A0A3G8H810_9BURK|nr:MULTISPECIES: DNA topoisomerase IB [Cupriavidus]AZG16518.1 DNA topoisomerase IB [Cupriavidus pauculus]MDT6963077.1 DNA topoisomerase IB [Cupriavidus sp. SZY C1]
MKPTPVADVETPSLDAALRKAGLHYVEDSEPGIARRRAGKGFTYVRPDGKRVDEATLARINALAIPPAYESVWICLDPNGHLQATGRDARGRKQYLYHPEWAALRDADKYARLMAFGHALPHLRGRVTRDLARNGMPREKVLAAVVALLDATLVRVGTPRYAEQNRTYGLTTLKRKHVAVRGSRLRFQFTGKSGVTHDVSVNDARLARVVRNCAELPGQRLFKYQDAEGQIREIGSTDVNAYLQEVTGGEFTAKDFRTWAGSVHALALLRKTPADSETARKRAVVEVIRTVAQRLRNTMAVCRKCYVHPDVLAAFMDDTLHALPAPRAAARLRSDEARLLALLENTATVSSSPRKAA